MSVVMTALLSSLVVRESGPSSKDWPTYLPLLIVLSVFMSFLLLLVLRRQAETIARPIFTTPANPVSRPTRLSPLRSHPVAEDLEAQWEIANDIIQITTNPSTPVSMEPPSARITLPGRMDGISHNPPPVNILHELSAYAEHR